MLKPIERHLDYNPCVEEDSPINLPIEIIVKEEVLDEKTNMVMSQLVVRSVVPNESISKYSVSDFFMENLIAAGAVANLKSCQFDDVDIDAISMQVDSALSNGDIL